MYPLMLMTAWYLLIVGCLLLAVGVGLGNVSIRRSLAAGAGSVLLLAGSCELIVSRGNLAAILIGIISLYQGVNGWRMVKHRMNLDYLNRSVKQTFLTLTGLQLVAVVAWIYSGNGGFHITNGVVLLGVVQALAAVGLLVSTVINLKRSMYRNSAKQMSDTELPTVSVCVPARNETFDMTECLQALVASDYPKLEILVLDDCSQDKTADIVRSFANVGVRFIPGEPSINDRWLAKNQAYQALTDAASGDIMLFCGVDVRFGEHTIRNIVIKFLTDKKSMVSLMPKRFGGGADTTFVQPLRYWWELSLPRFIGNRPPVLSTCWLIRRKDLLKAGAFNAVSHMLLPEAHFAKLYNLKNKYSFLRATSALELTTAKSVNDQLDTALRMRYPQVRRKPEMVCLITIIEISLFLLPFFMAVAGCWLKLGLAWPLSILACALLIANQIAILRASNPSNWWHGIYNLPVSLLVELVIGNQSMWEYEFGTVEWKGRNVCLPVMHAIPHLPEMS